MEVLKGIGGCGLCLAGTACASLPVVLTVYLGVYAFNNPDKEAWYGVVDEDSEALYASEADGKMVNATELVDIHKRFV